MSLPLTCTLQNSFNTPGLLEQWSTLCAAAGMGVFATPQWYQCWHRHYGQGELMLLKVQEGERLVGLVPLLRERRSLRGVPVQVVRFLENGHSLHNEILLLPQRRIEVFTALLQGLLERLADWDLLEFKNLPEDSPATAACRQVLGARGLRWSERPGLNSPYLRLDRSWAAFHGERSTRTRKTLRNLHNSLHRAGKVELLRLRSLADYLHWRTALLEVAAHSWTHQAGDSLASEQNLGFFDDLTRVAAEQGWLELWILTLDGRAIAFEYHLRYQGRVHALRSSYHQDFARLSPGACLDRLVVESLFDEAGGLREYDLGGSSDPYKQKWDPEVRPHTIVHIFQKTPRSRLLQGLEYGLVPLARRGRDWLRRVSRAEVSR